MAEYGLRYDIPWHNKTVDGSVRIYQDDFDSAVTPLKLTSNGIELRYSSKGNIIPLSASVEIVNDKSNFFDLLPLMMSDERRYKMEIWQSEEMIFQGFIDTPAGSEKYWRKRPIRLTASNHIAELLNTTPPILDETGKKSLIDVLHSALSETGQTDDILVNCWLESSTGSAYNEHDTLFNNCGVVLDAFQDGNSARLNAQQTINEILKPFDSYLYWYKGNWKIQRYADVGRQIELATKDYQKYEFGTSYEYGDNTATTVSCADVSTDIQDLTWIQNSQVISPSPTISEITVTLTEDFFGNLIINDFEGMSASDDRPEILNPSPTRKWTRSYVDHFRGGTIDVSGYFPADPVDRSTKNKRSNIGTTFGHSLYSLGNAIYRYGWAGELDAKQGPVTEHVYIVTAFDVTITPNDTDLTITWNHLLERNTNIGEKWTFSEGREVVQYSEQDTGLYYTVRWFLRDVADPSSFFLEDVDGNFYRTTNRAVLSADGIEVAPDYEQDSFNRIRVPASNALRDGRIECSATIPLGDPSCYVIIEPIDKKLVFGILMTQMYPNDGYNGWRTDKTGTSPAYPYHEIIGDIAIVASQDNTPNVITGKINTAGHQKLEKDIRLFDSRSLNIKNALFQGTNYTQRTEEWSDDDTEWVEIPVRLILDRYRVYNKPRQKITVDIRYVGSLLEPMGIYYDSLQTGKNYILDGYTYYPLSGIYRCNFSEYDRWNTTVPDYMEVDADIVYAYPAGNYSSAWSTMDYIDWDGGWVGWPPERA